MIEGLRPYADMVATGVDWIPSVPAHWEMRRSKYLVREVDKRSVTGDETHLSMNQRLGLIPSSESTQRRLVSESYIGGKLVDTNDLVLNRLKAHLGVFAYASQPGVISPDYSVFRPEPSVDVRYLEFVLKSPACRGELRTRTKGIVEGFWRLYTDDFYDIRLPYPPLEEQRLIVRFLDWHGGMTARLIRAKKRLIALLNEQKQAIIHHAVTRGLNPAAPLKPSGVDWLGDVPMGWEVLRIRNVADMRVSGVDKKTAENELPVRLCNYVDVYKNDSIHGDIPFMVATASEAEISRFRIRIGDVIITKDSEDWLDIGVPALVETEADDLVCAYHLALLRPKPDVMSGAFLFWQLLGPAARLQFSLSAAGVTRYGLGHGAIKAIPMIVPPLDVQDTIVAHLDKATATIRAAIKDAQSEITLIQEFRTRLIADVVTGQLDIRALAATLPDNADAAPLDDLIDNETNEDAETFEPEEADA